MRRCKLNAVAWLLIGFAFLPLPAAEPGGEAPPNSFAVAAWAFDRGNARTFLDQWADAGPMVAFGGHTPVRIEYDIDFPVTADYMLNIQYAAAEARRRQDAAGPARRRRLELAGAACWSWF